MARGKKKKEPQDTTAKSSSENLDTNSEASNSTNQGSGSQQHAQAQGGRGWGPPGQQHSEPQQHAQARGGQGRGAPGQQGSGPQQHAQAQGGQGRGAPGQQGSGSQQHAQAQGGRGRGAPGQQGSGSQQHAQAQGGRGWGPPGQQHSGPQQHAQARGGQGRGAPGQQGSGPQQHAQAQGGQGRGAPGQQGSGSQQHAQAQGGQGRGAPGQQGSGSQQHAQAQGGRGWGLPGQQGSGSQQHAQAQGGRGWGAPGQQGSGPQQHAQAQGGQGRGAPGQQGSGSQQHAQAQGGRGWGLPGQQHSGPQQHAQAQGSGQSIQVQANVGKLPTQQRPEQQQQMPSVQSAQHQVAQQNPISTSERSTSQSSDVGKTTRELSKMTITESSPLKLKSTADSRKEADAWYQKIPKRPNPLQAGTTGRKIEVYTNMMAIKFGKNFKTNVVHYDVDIQPNVPKYLQRPAFNEVHRLHFPNRWPAFDGKKNAFSAGLLPFGRESPIYEVKLKNEDGREKEFKVSLKVANELDLSWLKNVKPGLKDDEKCQTSIQALDIILRSAPALQAIAVGRSFFPPPTHQPYYLGGGMDLWIGLFQSVVLGWKPFLNIDVAHKAFPKSQNVIDLMKTICGLDESQSSNQGGRGGGFRGRGGGGRGGFQGGGRGREEESQELTPDLVDRFKADIVKFLKGLKVAVQVPNQQKRTQRVYGLVQCPRENVFEYNNKKITVEQYYAIEKKYKIKYPTLPCLGIGAREKNIHVPPEICTILPGQATQKKLDENQTAAMIKKAATDTNSRYDKIMGAYNPMHHNENKTIKEEFGVNVSGEFEVVPARVLKSPMIQYTKSTTVGKGVWRVERFKEPTRALEQENSWTILNLDSRAVNDEVLHNLERNLRATASKLGINMNKAKTPFKTISFFGERNVMDILKYFHEQVGLKLVIVIIPNNKISYSKVKQISEISVGVLTQCLKSFTLTRKFTPATQDNLLLKINAKLNGINHSLAEPSCDPFTLAASFTYMIVGADVTHPSPDATDIPSIAAVASSHDLAAFKYHIDIRLQPPREEMILELTEIMINHLKYFYRQQRGRKPKKIFYFRDGVSEGQFGQVLAKELMAIKRACQKLEQGYEPKITFLVVQKRHHIRLFPTDSRNSDDRCYNVQAGTIVDTHITHPSHIDFYLVSHASIQGTARPTKYRCLWDDSNMTQDQLEILTYFLCHMFSRCTRSVSYPTPTYYAHLAAFRARALTQDMHINLSNLKEEQKKITIKPNIIENSPMFFV